MPDYQQEATVSAPASALFDFLSDVRNLPKYFDKMESAEPRDGGEAVVTEAKLGDGRTVEGEAWFRVDSAAQKVSWGAEGPSGYHGELTVTGDDGTSRVTVALHSEKEHRQSVDDGLRTTLENIRKLVEEGPAPSS
jgi:uncharacterized membrane protein